MDLIDDLDEYRPLCLWCLENPPGGDLRISMDGLDYVRLAICFLCFNRLMHRLPHTGEYRFADITPRPDERYAWLIDHPDQRIVYQCGPHGTVQTLIEDREKPDA